MSRVFAMLLVLLIAGSARGEPAPATPGALGATPISGRAAFDAFHGEAGVRRVVADLVARCRRDPRIAEIFRATDLARLQTQLGDQICALLGGPCLYRGKSMAEAHKDVGLQDTDLNAMVEDLQAAMDDEHVPFGMQNQLLAKLAPMRRVVVVR